MMTDRKENYWYVKYLLIQDNEEIPEDFGL